MHEMSLVRSVVDIVLGECEGKNIEEVTAVELIVGEYTDVIDEYVEKLFRFLARGTIAENAEVRIKKIPAYVRCNECGNIFPFNVHDESTRTCPHCGAYKKFRYFSGREFRIENIEVKAGAPTKAAKRCA